MKFSLAIGVIVFGVGCSRPIHYAGIRPMSDALWGKPIKIFAPKALKLLPNPNGHNFGFSPISMQICLATLYPGLGSADRTKLKNAINASPQLLDNPLATLALMGNLATDDLPIHNSVWIYSKYHLNENYQNTLTSRYGASAQSLDKLGSQGANRVNNWVYSATKGRIPRLYNSLPNATRFLIVNTVTFDGKWSHKFLKSNTSPESFFSNLHDLKTKIMVPMMHGNFAIPVAKESDCTIAQFDYKGNGFAMDVVLPKAGVDPWISLLKHDRSLSAPTGVKFQHQMTQVSMPKFEFTSTCHLKPLMMNLGLGSFFWAFSHSIFINEPVQLQIDKAIQKNYIKTDENGTKAAAGTGIIIQSKGIELISNHFTVDRPFAFVIGDPKLGIIAFAGVIYNPKLK